MTEFDHDKVFTIDHRPSADGAVWHVISPQGTSVWRTSDIGEARIERNRRNGGDRDE